MNIVINPPPPSFPQPTLLEEPPIPVGLKVDLGFQQQESHPSISLVLPKKQSSNTIDNQKAVLALNNAEDSSSTISQQEEFSVKGMLTDITK
jgi:hypothetical protein